MRRSKRRRMALRILPHVAIAALGVAGAITLSGGSQSTYYTPTPTTFAPVEPLRADAWIGPRHEARVSWDGMVLGGANTTFEVRIRRADGTLTDVRDAVPDDVDLRPGRVGERLRLEVIQRIGPTATVGHTVIRVRPGTRLERCLPADLGAYPSYCAPEKVAQEGDG
jgi:hypothetical protein